MRRLLCLACAAALGSSAAGAQPANDGSGKGVSAEEMRHWCRGLETAGGKPTNPDMLQVGYCLGSFMTLRNAAMLNALPRTCIPEEATMADILRVYLRAIDETVSMSESIRENWFVAAVVILQSKYPCS